MTSLLNLVCSTTWALRPEALEAITALVQKVDLSRYDVAAAFHYSEARRREAARAYETKIPLQAVGAYRAEYVRDSINLFRRGPVAILPVTGPITRYSNLFQMMSGQGTSVESLAKDFRMAVDDPSVSSVLLSVDSPGGESNGINEFAKMVFEARGEKPIWAYVSDLGASAAYWIASATERVVVAETAALGSIGCMAVFSEAADEPKKLVFVSSVSPRKNLDPSTKSGASEVQALVDTLGQIFVNSVANFRGTTAEDVEANYGRGGILVGADAVAAGLADSVGTFEGCLADLGEVGLEDSQKRAPRAHQAAAVNRLVDMVASLEPVAPVLSYTLTQAMEVTSLANTGILSSSPVLRVDIDPVVDDNPPIPEVDDPPPQEDTPSTTAPEAAMSDQTTPPITVDAAAAELAALKAENARLRFAAYKAQAESFADARIAEMKAFPGEREHIVAQYTQAALDDENFGPTSSGTTRLQQLANAIAARTSVSYLTAEAIAPTAMQALHQKVTAAGADPNAPMTEDKKAQLLGYSPLGKSLLNGQGSN